MTSARIPERPTSFRYYVGLVTITAILALVLGGIQLFQWWGNVDTTIDLRSLNQRIAPAAVACPAAYYPQDAVIECMMEGDKGRSPVNLKVLSTGLEFEDEGSAENLIAALTGAG
jgi:hypothetical protein